MGVLLGKASNKEISTFWQIARLQDRITKDRKKAAVITNQQKNAQIQLTKARQTASNTERKYSATISDINNKIKQNKTELQTNRIELQKNKKEYNAMEKIVGRSSRAFKQTEEILRKNKIVLRENVKDIAQFNVALTKNQKLFDGSNKCQLLRCK